MSTCQVHVHCPEDKFLPNQNANERISDFSKSNKGKWTFTPRRGTVLIKKKAMIGQKKGMVHWKRAWRSKKRAWPSAILKGPRGNTITFQNRKKSKSGFLEMLPSLYI